MTRTIVPLALAAATAVLAAPAAARPADPAGTPTATAAARTVVLKDSFFSPRSVTIRRRGSVRFAWSSRNRLPHNLVGPGAPRRVRTPKQRHRSVTIRYARKGTYRYQCTIHPGMTGRVRVR